MKERKEGEKKMRGRNEKGTEQEGCKEVGQAAIKDGRKE